MWAVPDAAAISVMGSERAGCSWRVQLDIGSVRFRKCLQWLLHTDMAQIGVKDLSPEPELDVLGFHGQLEYADEAKLQ